MLEKIGQSKWFKNLIEVLNLTFILGLSFGIIIGLVKSPKHNLKQVLTFVLSSINEMLLITSLFLFLYLVLFLALRRMIKNLKWACFTAGAILLTPLFLFWIVKIDIMELRVTELSRFFELRNIIWNSIFSIGFILVWFIVSSLFFLWTKSRILKTPTVNVRGLVGLLGIVLIIAIPVFHRLYTTYSLDREEAVAAYQLKTGQKLESKTADKMVGEIKELDLKAVQVYRFDDRLGDAPVVEAASPIPDESIVGFDFESSRESWKPTDKRYVSTLTENGFLKIAIGEKVSSIEADGLNISAEKIQAVVLRMRVNKGENFELWWKRTKDKDFYFKYKTRVKIPANNKFLTFKIKTLNLRRWDGLIDRIRLYPTDKEGSEIELDYIHFITENSYFSEKIGVDNYEIDSQVRKVIYSHSPSLIKYRITVPHQAFMSFGMGIIDPRIPTDFEVLLGENGSEEKLYVKRLYDKKWHDAEVVMSKWEGKDITITFKTSSEKTGSVAFWSNPIIYTSNKKRPPNILIYLIDCFRADHISAYGYARDTTPNINNLANEGVLFLNPYAQYTSTRPSVSSLFSSQYFSAHKVTSETHKRLSDNFDTIAEVLRNLGYSTVAFTAESPVGPQSSLDQGFEQFFLKGLNIDGDRYGKDLSAVIPWLRNNIPKNRAFFLYLHTGELHQPYMPPEPYYSMYSPNYEGTLEENYKKYRWYANKASGFMVPKKDIGHMIDVYDGSITLADDKFGKIVKVLKELGVYDNTIIIVTGDHGEVFNEHNNWAHHGPPYRELVRVPLIMRFPPLIPQGRVISENVQLIDVAPTILDLINVSPNEEFQGISLLPLIKNQNVSRYKNRKIYSEGGDRIALIQDKSEFMTKEAEEYYKLGKRGSIKRILGNYFPSLFDFFKIPRNELYDLENDPTEKYNISIAELSKSNLYEKDIIEWLEVQNKIYSEKVKSPKKRYRNN